MNRVCCTVECEAGIKCTSVTSLCREVSGFNGPAIVPTSACNGGIEVTRCTWQEPCISLALAQFAKFESHLIVELFMIHETQISPSEFSF